MSGNKNLSSLNMLKRDISHSNLNIFKEGKADIIKIYLNIYDYVKECNNFLNDLESAGNMFKQLVNDADSFKIKSYVEKVKVIQGVVSRNQMKCAFFGRTSNGKSTTINAILGEKILPSGLGHTTSCFLEIQGTEEKQGFLVVTYPNAEGNEVAEQTPKPVDSISELASDLSSKKVSVDALIKIFWPSTRCPLLSEDVIFIDSPGIDVEVDIDKWIDICCLDADVFVYVANAESTINISEKKFFMKVRDKLSKPNIFIVNNRWDASAQEEPDVAEMTKKQHMEKFVNFLTKELKVCSKAEAESRVFFVSAKEALINRTKKSGDTAQSPGPNTFTEGWQNRYFEFSNFEKNLEKVLSESATKTKFASHSSEGFEIISEIKIIMDGLHENSQEQRNCAINLTQKLKTEMDRMIHGQKEVYRVSQSKISKLSSKVAEKVAQSLREELRLLDDLIDGFNLESFNEDRQRLAQYKMKLSSYVEDGLSHNLEDSCSEEIHGMVNSISKDIIKRSQDLTTDSQIQEQIRKCQIHDFKPEFKIDCTNYHSDFHEDLSFRFSLGPTVLLGRIFGFNNTNVTPSFSSLETSFSSLMSLRNRLPSVISPGKVAIVGLIGTGVMFKTVSWRVLGACAAVYGGLYLYEYSMYTSRSREKLFKMQYSRYLSEKLRLTMDYTSRNSAMQPQIVLKSMLKDINVKIDDQVTQMKVNLTQFEKDSDKLQELVNGSKALKNKATFLDNNIKDFEEKFLN